VHNLHQLVLEKYIPLYMITQYRAIRRPRLQKQ